MSTMATVRVNTTQHMVLYRDFVIQEVGDHGAESLWDWTHEEYWCDPERAAQKATGECRTLFECIDAIDNWHGTTR